MASRLCDGWNRAVARQVSRVNPEIVCQTAAADGGIAVLPCFLAYAAPNLQRVFRESIDFHTFHCHAFNEQLPDCNAFVP